MRPTALEEAMSSSRDNKSPFGIDNPPKINTDNTVKTSPSELVYMLGDVYRSK